MINKKLIILFVVALLSFSAFSQLNIKNYLYVGYSEMTRNNYTTAISIFNTIIKVKPNHYEALLFRGHSKYKLDDYRGALKDLNASIDLNSYNAEAFLYRGIVKDLLSDNFGALYDFNKGLELNPRHIYIFFNRGITRLRLKNWTFAIDNFDNVIKLKPDFSAAYINRGIAKSNLSRIDDAMADYNTAIRLNPFSADGYSRRGMLKASKKDYDGAILDLDESIKLDSYNTLNYYLRAGVKYEMNDFKGMIDDYDKIIDLDPTNALTFYNRAIIKSKLGDHNSAIEDYNKVSVLSPNNVFTYYNRGLVHNEIGLYNNAINDFSKAIEIFPDFAKAYMARSQSKRTIGDIDGSIKDNNTAISKINEYRLKNNLSGQPSFADTSRNFREIIDLDSDFGKILSNGKIINGRIQDRDVNIELEPVFKFLIFPDDSLAIKNNKYYVRELENLNLKARVKLKLFFSNESSILNNEILEEKVDVLNNSELSDSAQDAYYFYKSIVNCAARNYNSAIEEANKSLSYAPNVSYYFNRANIRLEMIEFIASTENNNNFVNINKSFNYDKSIKENESYNYDQVILDYQKCIEIDPDFVFAYFNLANVKCLARDFEGAVKHYTTVIQKNNEIAEAYYNRGLTLLYLKRNKEACIDLGKAGELGILKSYSVIKRFCNKED
ncbi:tetratricopeptide repeat protein [Bacteroidota bacterium]